VSGDEIRCYGSACRKEDTPNRQLDCGEGVEKPRIRRVSDEEKARNNEHSQYIAPDEYVFPIVSIGKNTGERADQEWSKHPYYKECAQRETRSRQLCEQGCRRDQVEPVAEQIDNLAKPEVAPISVIPDQGPVADGLFFGVVFCQAEFSPSMRNYRCGLQRFKAFFKKDDTKDFVLETLRTRDRIRKVACVCRARMGRAKIEER
jgi:hypothetical protein